MRAVVLRHVPMGCLLVQPVLMSAIVIGTQLLVAQVKCVDNTSIIDDHCSDALRYKSRLSLAFR